MSFRSFVSAPVLLALCLAGAVESLRAGEAPARSPPPADSLSSSDASLDELDEVTVKGARLHELRAAMVVAEDEFYARYNELNQNDEFDIQCENSPRTGSSRVVRKCYPRVVASVKAAEADAYFEAMLANDNLAEAHSFAQPRGAPSYDVMMKFPDYQQNMLRLLRRHPELRRLVKEREKLEGQYEKLRKAR